MSNTTSPLHVDGLPGLFINTVNEVVAVIDLSLCKTIMYLPLSHSTRNLSKGTLNFPGKLIKFNSSVGDDVL